MRRRPVLLLTMFIVLVVSTTPVFAGTILVSSMLDDGTGCTLREAIAEANTDGATLGNGCGGATAGANTITLPPGTYTIDSQLPNVTTTITIQPTSGTNVTIQASASPNTATYRVMRVTNATGNLTLQNLTIRHGGNIASSLDGGCLLVDNFGTLSLTNVNVENCRGRFGGGVSVFNATLSVSGGSLIRNNQANRDGGGIDAQSASVTITNSTIRDNQNVNPANNGAAGGLTALDLSSLTINGGRFINNSVGSALGGLGGAIYYAGFVGGSGSITNSVFINNRATGAGSNDGGAIYHTGDDALTISSSRFESNTADDGGDAIYHSASFALTITGSCFTNNGDTAVFDTFTSSFVIANGGGNIANANWWGSSWGPRIPALGESTGSFYSTGDSINGNGATAVANQLVNVGLTSAGDGDTAPTGAWLTSAPTVAGALCQTQAVPSTGAWLNVTVPFQGRPAAPNTRLIVPLRVILKPTSGGVALIDTTLSTDQNAVLPTLSAAPGSYTLWIKGSHTLARSQTVNLVVGSNNLTLSSMLPEGDTDNDNQIILADFSLLAAAFGSVAGTGGFNAQADYNGDGQVQLIDFSLLASNFGTAGAPQP